MVRLKIRAALLLTKSAALILHSLKKYEKTNAVNRNILSVMSLRVVVYCLFIEKGKYEYKQIVCG